jgi:hypothetical protein
MSVARHFCRLLLAHNDAISIVINNLAIGTFIAYLMALTKLKEAQMSAKRMIALTGALLVLATGLALAQEKKANEANKIQVKTQAQTPSGNQAQTRARARVRTQFVDQNGDGINDVYRDHDNDGVPNCQDPEWTRPRDGSGYQGGQGNGQGNAGIKAGNRKGSPGNPGFSNRSFRNAPSVAGTSRPGCDGTGPKGKNTRRGRG